MSTYVILLLLSMSLIICSPRLAESSWFIDPAQYHISAHGQYSCLDCHAQLENKKHPDPSLVNEKLIKFFSAEECFGCHPEVRHDLEEKKHQTRKIKRPDRFVLCINCHNPHYRQRKDFILKSKEIKVPGKSISLQSGLYYDGIALMDLYTDNWACLECHLEPLLGESQMKQMQADFCLDCHGEAAGIREKFPKTVIPKIALATLQKSKHGDLTCLECHSTSPRFNHKNRKLETCLHCHDRHGAEDSGDIHLRVSCEACHLKGIVPVKDEKTGFILAKIPKGVSMLSPVHGLMRKDDEETCIRCHKEKNKLGAPDMVLGSKSILCLPCHEGSLIGGGVITMLSLLVFFAGLVLLVSRREDAVLDNSGKIPLTRKLRLFIIGLLKSLFSIRTVIVVKSGFLDALLNRKLYGISPMRWSIYRLIFLSMLFRFGWGVFASSVARVAPKSQFVWLMLDKDYPLTPKQPQPKMK